MLGEMESLRLAMKDTHYRRIIDRLTRSIRDTKSLDDALPAALGMVVEAIRAETGSLWFYERFKDGRIYPKAVFNGADMTGVYLLPGEGIAGQVIESGKAVIIADCQADPRWAGRVDEKTGFRTDTMICVPLVLNGLVFGSIQIINKTDGLCFDEKDLTFTQRLASEIALLLKHQGLLEEYMAAAKSVGFAEDKTVSFLDVFGAKSERELEYQIRGMKEFSALYHGEQQEVLRLAKELRKYFAKAK